ncbi:MAG TPA: hypothetical protein DGH68_04045 [Bacteroidetes bacterium]|nr:hypothetical protein [Bacteroidota bacterium]
MPAYILIKAVDGWTPADPMVYQKGYPVVVMETDQYVGAQVLPTFVQLVISDATVDDVKHYAKVWMREVDWEIIASNLSIDGHRLRVFTKASLVSASGLNSLTREKVEAFLNKWGASIISVAANSVTFDILISHAIQSDGFWDRDVSDFVFTETGYVQTGGIHTTEANYSSVAEANPNNVAAAIVRAGGTVINNDAINKKMTFTIPRSTVLDKFKGDVGEKTYGPFACRATILTPAAVDAIIAAGGNITRTKAQVASYLHDRLTD